MGERGLPISKRGGLEHHPSSATLFGNGGPRASACPQARGRQSAPGLSRKASVEHGRADGGERENARAVDPQGEGEVRGRGEGLCSVADSQRRPMEWKSARLLKRGDEQRAFHEIGYAPTSCGEDMKWVG